MSTASSGWLAFEAAVSRAGALVADSTPDDELDRAEGARYVARLARWVVDTIVELRDPSSPELRWDSPKIGGDNPDYLYGSAALSGSHEYELTVVANDAFRIGIGTYAGGLGTTEGLRRTGYLASEQLIADAGGQLRVRIGGPPGDGNHLAVSPDTTSLLIRETLLDRRTQRPADFALRRIDVAPPAGPPTSGPDIDERLRAAAATLVGVVEQFLSWTERFRRQPNTMGPLDADLLAQAQGDEGTQYLNGYFSLADDEELVLDVDPGPCDYWNVQLTNHWLESLDFLRYRTHVNQATAVVNADGRAEVTVSMHGGAGANDLDATGHRRGGLAMRVVGGGRPAVVGTRVRTRRPNP